MTATSPGTELTMEWVPVGALRPHPKNARRGDVAAIAESIAHNGQYRPVIVNRGNQTGRPNEILAGHHIALATESLGRDLVMVSYVDVDDKAGEYILAVDNRAPELGEYDTEALFRLLADLPDLSGTGYSADDLDDMRVLLEQVGDEVVIEDDAPPKPKFDFNPDVWAAADRRIMVLDLAIPVFIWLQRCLEQLGELWSLDSNVDVMTRLISDATGTPIPVPEDSHDPDEE